jgi:hypothetical protein
MPMPASPPAESVDTNIYTAARQRSYFTNGAAFLYLERNWMFG